MDKYAIIYIPNFEIQLKEIIKEEIPQGLKMAKSK
jgi:hypothetical protein